MKIRIRIILDVSMTVLFLLQMAYHLIGNSFHEWIGIVLFVLVMIHNILNWKWYTGLRKGKYIPARLFHTVLNLLLLISCLCLMFSAVLLSPTLSAPLQLQATMLGREMHIIFTTWSFVLMSAHVGLHWDMVVGAIKKRIVKRQRFLWNVARVVVLFVSIYGLYAFISRGLTQRMFLQVKYVFFDYEESFVLFMGDHIAMLCLFACIAYWGKSGCSKNGKR